MFRFNRPIDLFRKPYGNIGLLVEVATCKEQCARGDITSGCWAYSGAYAKFRKATIATITFVILSVRRFVRMEQLSSHWTDCHEI